MPNVHLRKRTLKDGIIGYYLDYYVNGKRYYETLDIKIDPKYPKKTQKILENKATTILYQKKADILNNLHPELIEHELVGGTGNFFILFEEMKNKRKATSMNTYGVWENCEKRLLEFNGSGTVQYRHVTKTFCQDFLSYLRKYSGVTAGVIDESTVLTYYRKFQSVVKEGHKMGLIKEDYSSMVKNLPKDRRDEKIRHTLTMKEIRAIKNTEFFNKDIQNAFLFCCFTGLRLSDVRKLTWGDINIHSGTFGDADVIYIMELQQKKTKKPVIIPFTQETFNLLGKKRGKEDELIFNISPFNGSPSRTLGLLLKKVDSSTLKRKKITFHSSRHTFGTLCVNSFGDIYATQRLMGHSDQKSTQGYAQKEVGSLVESIKRLPSID
jgi:integrase